MKRLICNLALSSYSAHVDTHLRVHVSYLKEWKEFLSFGDSLSEPFFFFFFQAVFHLWSLVFLLDFWLAMEPTVSPMTSEMSNCHCVSRHFFPVMKGQTLGVAFLYPILGNTGKHAATVASGYACVETEHNSCSFLDRPSRKQGCCSQAFKHRRTFRNVLKLVTRKRK